MTTNWPELDKDHLIKICIDQNIELDALRAKLAAMESQTPAATVKEWNKGGSGEFKELIGIDKLEDGQVLYSKPVPADKPAVAVPDGYALTLNGQLNRNWVTFDGMPSAEGMRDNYISRCRPADLPKLEIVPLYLAAAPSHSQQSSPWLKDNQIAGIINSVRDVALTYAGTQQLRDRIAGVLRPVLCGLADRCPSHESEHSAVCESVQTEPDRSGMYFYKNSDCAALHPQSPDCKCWYKYGTGPLSSMKCESEQGGAV